MLSFWVSSTHLQELWVFINKNHNRFWKMQGLVQLKWEGKEQPRFPDWHPKSWTLLHRLQLQNLNPSFKLEETTLVCSTASVNTPCLSDTHLCCFCFLTIWRFLILSFLWKSCLQISLGHHGDVRTYLILTKINSKTLKNISKWMLRGNPSGIFLVCVRSSWNTFGVCNCLKV